MSAFALRNKRKSPNNSGQNAVKRSEKFAFVFNNVSLQTKNRPQKNCGRRKNNIIQLLLLPQPQLQELPQRELQLLLPRRAQ